MALTDTWLSKSAKPREKLYKKSDGQCDGTLEQPTITCSFRQMRVARNTKDEDIPAEIAEAKKMLSDEVSKSGIEAVTDAYCRDLKLNGEEIRSRIESVGDPYQQKLFERMVALCAKPTYEKFEDLVVDMVVRKAKTCTVSYNDIRDRFVFKKVGTNKWISNSGPVGLCNTTLLISLEKEEGSSFLWSYEQVRTSVNGELDLCKAMEVNKPLAYSWRASDTIDINCSSVSFE